MDNAKRLRDGDNAKLAPIIQTAMDSARKQLAGGDGQGLELTGFQGFHLDRDQDELLRESGAAYILVEVRGDVDGNVVFVCPIKAGIAIASVARGLSDSEAAARLNSDRLDVEEEEALGGFGAHIASGLTVALTESSLHSLQASYGTLGMTAEWDPSAVFPETDLVCFTMDCSLADGTQETTYLVMSQSFVHDVTGLDLNEAGGEAPGPSPAVMGGDPSLTVLGVAFNPEQEAAARGLACERNVKLVVVEDIRNVLGDMVNHNVAFAVIGCRGDGQPSKEASINIATLKRLRRHPKGKDLPVLYIIESPEKEHILDLSALSIREIIALPAPGDIVEMRMQRFFDSMLESASRKAA